MNILVEFLRCSENGAAEENRGSFKGGEEGLVDLLELETVSIPFHHSIFVIICQQQHTGPSQITPKLFIPANK